MFGFDTREGIMVDARRAQSIAANLERIGAASLARRVAAKHRVPYESMLTRRFLTSARAKRELLALLRHSIALSYPELGAIFDLDHTTVMSAVKKREGEIAADLATGRR